MAEHITMDQIRRTRAIVNATYYPDGNLPSPRVPEACTAERPFGPCTQRCDQPAGHDGLHKAQCFTWHECTCPTYRFDDSGDIEALPQGTNPDCRHCHPEEDQ